MVCPKCNSTISDNAGTCPNCGQYFPTSTSTMGGRKRSNISLSFYEFYLRLCVIVATILGGALGFFMGTVCALQSENGPAYKVVFTIVGIVLGWCIGKIITITPKLLLIIAQNTDGNAGGNSPQTAVNNSQMIPAGENPPASEAYNIEESRKKLIELRSKGLISQAEYEKRWKEMR
ncbi:MAG: hypothetical protein J5532_07290 [Lachnospiraceae bacterium]|nr:hypothetical protein [Lachnospiraceae bacterium]